MSNTVNCPLLNRTIDTGICFDIAMYAEGLSPVRFIPEELQHEKDIPERCLQCEHHKTD